MDQARDGFVSLHEDSGQSKSMVYSFENRKTVGPFSLMLINELGKHFEKCNDGVLISDDGELEEDTVIKNGISLNNHDGSFEDYLFHRGVPQTACTETPGKLDINLRIMANCEIIKGFINYINK